MGLLDEAIRQHLELKRRHGADPSEVARQEQEALGPPRRGTAAEEVELADPDELELSEDELADEDLADEELPDGEDELDHESYPYEEDEGGGLEPTGEPEAPVTPAASVDQPTQAFTPADLEPGDPEHEPAEPEPAAGEEPETRAHTEGEEEQEDPEDVLEETPEFLQETPEHDRLWFEQRPPRDFDF